MWLFVLTRAIRRNIPEVAILHSHRRENLKNFISDNQHMVLSIVCIDG
jgi:hypothetical protein